MEDAHLLSEKAPETNIFTVAAFRKIKQGSLYMEYSPSTAHIYKTFDAQSRHLFT